MSGALLLQFDIADDARAEHDDWHTHEHMPERLALPGFRRGSRWTALDRGPRYCVLYEVDGVDALDSAAYRARLDAPTPWTAKMMRSYAGMQRTLCDAVAASGGGLGSVALVARWTQVPDRASSSWRRLAEVVVPALASRPGLATATLLAQARPAAMTREQAIRGRDASAAAALFATGYDEPAVRALAVELRNGAADAAPATADVYRLAYVLACSTG